MILICMLGGHMILICMLGWTHDFNMYVGADT